LLKSITSFSFYWDIFTIIFFAIIFKQYLAGIEHKKHNLAPLRGPSATGGAG